MASKENSQIKPFLKWAGGKTQLIPEIAKRIPYSKHDSFTYIEPFVGSGAVLFWILNNYPNISQVVINDLNTNLINAYQAISNNLEELISILQVLEKEYHAIENDSEAKRQYYYFKREQFNLQKNEKIERSALLIFLNRTCYNGLYRVNNNGLFNVPMGSYRKPLIFKEENLRRTSMALRKIALLSADFEETLAFSGKNSFFYFDPPYKPINSTSSFNSYNKLEFNDNEQLRLKEFCDKLNKKGHKWLLSNSDPEDLEGNKGFFDNLYANYTIERVLASRNINSKGEKRGKLNELLIRNY